MRNRTHYYKYFKATIIFFFCIQNIFTSFSKQRQATREGLRVTLLECGFGTNLSATESSFDQREFH